MPRINLELSVAGIDELIQKLDKLDNALWNTEQPLKNITDAGKEFGKSVLANALTTFPGPRDASILSQAIRGKGRVVMFGESAAFIEFGAGVHYNGSEPYPLPRPAGIVGIGEYGEGHGKEDMWQYGHKWTHGNPAAKPLYYASLVMEHNVVTEFKAVVDNAVI